MPAEVGEHLINVSVGDVPIEGSPFRAAVFNPKAIKVTRVPSGVVGRPVEIESKFDSQNVHYCCEFTQFHGR